MDEPFISFQSNGCSYLTLFKTKERTERQKTPPLPFQSFKFRLQSLQNFPQVTLSFPTVFTQKLIRPLLVGIRWRQAF